MSRTRGFRFLVLGTVLAALAGCATNRILRCEGRLVPINPPPKMAVTTPAPARKTVSPRRTEHRP